jgi:hypothetical protein
LRLLGFGPKRQAAILLGFMPHANCLREGPAGPPKRHRRQRKPHLAAIASARAMTKLMESD